MEKVLTKPVPHPTRKIFKAYKVSVGAIRQQIGRSYGYTCNVLAGNVETSENMEALLWGLAERLDPDAVRQARATG